MSLDGKSLENGESRMPEVITFVRSEMETSAMTRFPDQGVSVRVTILPYANKEGVGQAVDIKGDSVSGFLTCSVDFFKGTDVVARESAKVTIFGDFKNGLRCVKMR